MTVRLRLLVLLPVVAALTLVFQHRPPAEAFKPYTHNYTGFSAYDDVVDDGRVTINGRAYTVRPEVVNALRSNRASYNAGVVGPDGFPDLTYGQSIIHPENTGAWLRHILARAWDAQSGSSYSAAERAQILAFAYGYLSHASGDIWAHTLVNDFALGVFPAVGEILTDIEDAEIALRHIIVEGYIGDATPSFDGNVERGPAPGGDTSDDSTPQIPYDAPHAFVYNTLIAANAGAPSAERGPLIGFFTSLRAQLATFAYGNPPPISDALSTFQVRKGVLDNLNFQCEIIPHTDPVTGITVHFPRNLGNCLLAIGELIGTTVIDFGEALFNTAVSAAQNAIHQAAQALFGAYVKAWIEDIDAGLRNWDQFGLATSQALFDPQARRDAQNFLCSSRGAESSLLRGNCEDGVGMLDVLLFKLDGSGDPAVDKSFLKQYLLPMLGLPDAASDVLSALQTLQQTLDTLLQPLGILFNPIREGIELIKEFAKEQIKEAIKDRYGIDIDALKDFFTHPTAWLNVQSANVAGRSLRLFSPADHARLDAILGLPPNHHVTDRPISGVPASTRLSDTAVLNPESFAPLRNAITLNKLLLLDGGELNRALGDILAGQGLIGDAALVRTYPAQDSVAGNIMVRGLDGNPWLKSIDSDHGWRADGLPRFCTQGTASCVVGGTLLPGTETPSAPIPRTATLNAGSGQFPIWESCLLRPAFRALFRDWENGDQQFPDLGDAPSSDPSDPQPPVSTLNASGVTHTAAGKTYVARSHTFTLAATDAVFKVDKLGLRYRVYKDGTAPGAWQTLPNGGTFSLPATATDGTWKIDFQAEDPCHTFDESDTLSPEAVRSQAYVLDTTGPAITFTSPAADAVFDTDDTSAIRYTVADPGEGSGVKSDMVTLDGQSATNGQTLDMFLLAPGMHTIAVSATDNLNNASSATRTFRVAATAGSLLSNVERARGLGLITDPDVYSGLKDKLDAAIDAHGRGRHDTEHNQLTALINQLEAQRGKGIDAATADRFIAFARDLIARGG